MAGEIDRRARSKRLSYAVAVETPRPPSSHHVPLVSEVSNETPGSRSCANLGLLRRLEESSPKCPDVIIDMKEITYLNSSNIAQLLRLRRQVIAGNRQLRICAVADQVWSMLLLTGLDKIFEFTDNVATSLASIQIQEDRAEG